MGHTKLQAFKGLQSDKENAKEFLEDLDWAYEQDYKLNEPNRASEAEEYQTKTKKILFRQHLEGDAYEWYADLEMEDKRV